MGRSPICIQWIRHMRRDANWNYIEDGDKYYILIELYNAWHKRTMFMSTGNTNVDEWDKLLEYCKNNKTEAAHFYLDLIDCYEDEHEEGIRSDNFVGFFCDIIGEIFKDDGIPTFTGFIEGSVVQATYKIWIEECYFGDKNSLTCINKFKTLLT